MAIRNIVFSFEYASIYRVIREEKYYNTRVTQHRYIIGLSKQILWDLHATPHVKCI